MDIVSIFRGVCLVNALIMAANRCVPTIPRQISGSLENASKLLELELSSDLFQNSYLVTGYF
jgi:hypothetical protein